MSYEWGWKTWKRLHEIERGWIWMVYINLTRTHPELLIDHHNNDITTTRTPRFLWRLWSFSWTCALLISLSRLIKNYGNIQRTSRFQLTNWKCHLHITYLISHLRLNKWNYLTESIHPRFGLWWSLALNTYLKPEQCLLVGWRDWRVMWRVLAVQEVGEHLVMVFLADFVVTLV